MGIKRLRQTLQKGIVRSPSFAKRIACKRVAFDGQSLIFRGMTSCVEALRSGQPTSNYLVSVTKPLIELREVHKVIPVVVFDGEQCSVEKSLRKKQRDAVEEVLSTGDATRGVSSMSLSVDIGMKHAVVRALQHHNIETVLAPREADAQLAHLRRIGYVDEVAAEDSDLLMYRSAYPILSKLPLGDVSGPCEVADVPTLATKFPEWFPSPKNKSPAITEDQFVGLCCLFGCDYAERLKNMRVDELVSVVGPRFRGSSKPMIAEDVAHVYRNVKHQDQRKEARYVDEVMTAYIVLKDHPVYDPRTRKVVPFSSSSPFLLAPHLNQKAKPMSNTTKSAPKMAKDPFVKCFGSSLDGLKKQFGPEQFLVSKAVAKRLPLMGREQDWKKYLAREQAMQTK